jgi:hypothetical protein
MRPRWPAMKGGRSSRIHYSGVLNTKFQGCAAIDLIPFAVEPLTTKILWMWIAGSLICFAITCASPGFQKLEGEGSNLTNRLDDAALT